MNISIDQISFHLPSNVLTNKNLKDMFSDFDEEKFKNKIGIIERRFANENETSLDLAFFAAHKLLEKENKNDIDFILFCTQSPDYLLPTSACILQERLGLSKNIGALDYNLGCSGYIYGLAIAKGLIFSGVSKKILLVTAETYSKYIHPKNKSNKAIFGDAGSASIVSLGGSGKIGDFILGTDGSGFDKLIVKNGGSRNKSDEAPIEYACGMNDFTDENHLYMNGPEIYNFTLDVIPKTFEKILKINNLSVYEIDYFIFHQANNYMLDYLCKKLKIPKNKFHNEMYYTGNTVSCTIPIALFNALSQGKVKRGDKILLLGFGVGLSWGGTIITL